MLYSDVGMVRPESSAGYLLQKKLIEGMQLLLLFIQIRNSETNLLSGSFLGQSEDVPCTDNAQDGVAARTLAVIEQDNGLSCGGDLDCATRYPDRQNIATFPLQDRPGKTVAHAVCILSDGVSVIQALLHAVRVELLIVVAGKKVQG